MHLTSKTRPFMYGVAIDENHFIGRQKEQSRLAANMRAGISTILIAPRRYGKTSLVNRVANEVSTDELIVVKLDVFACRDEYEFYNMFAEAVLHQTSSKFEEWRENARSFMERLMPKISFATDALQEYSVSLGITPKTHKPEEVLDLPQMIAEKKNCRIVVCIDEFQQIGEMPDSVNIQKRLRSVWQNQSLVSYCLSGSKKHLMTTLFQSRSHPFYKFGDTMYLDRIGEEDWLSYLKSRYEERGLQLPDDMAQIICQKVQLHPSYVQQLAWMTMLNTNDIVTMDTIGCALSDLLNDNDALYSQQTESLTKYQVNFLRALLAGVEGGYGTTKTRDEYDLGTASNIARIKTALTEKELIESDGKRCFIADPVLQLWLKKRL